MSELLVPASFLTKYKDVFDTVERGQTHGTSIEWEYDRSTYDIAHRYLADGGVKITLSLVEYDGDFNPHLRPTLHVTETDRGQEKVKEELPKGSVPHDAYHAPELVLRSLLTSVQASMQLRRKEGLII